MYTYITNVVKLAQDIVDSKVQQRRIAVDATLGTGGDADFLATRFDKVYAFDIQQKAIDDYQSRKPDNLTLIHDSHHHFSTHISETVDCFMYNLGYLPGSDKLVTTQSATTIESMRTGLDILSSGGLMVIVIYTGHPGGKEERDAVLAFAKSLDKRRFAVLTQTFLNRSEDAPMLVVIEKTLG